MVRLTLLYNDCLTALIDGQQMDAFLRSSLWKVRLTELRAICPRIESNRIVSSKDVPVGALRKIKAQIDSLVKRGLCVATYDDSLIAHLLREETYIEERSHVGMAIKSQDGEVQAKFEDFRRVVDETMVRPLRDKQAWDAFFMTTMRQSANFSVPGSGKTASVLGTFAYLRNRYLVNKLIVISPINAFGSWRDEWRNCFGDKLACKSLCFHDQRFANVSADDRRRELLLNVNRYNLVLVNYQQCGKYKKELGEIASENALLVFDEVHRVKRIDGVLAQSALHIAKDAVFTIALTGTPIPNSYSDIYNLLHILYPNDYDTFFGFGKMMLANPTQDDINRINNAVQPFFCRTNKQMLGVPLPNPDEIVYVDATMEENELLLQVRSEMCDEPLAMIIRIMQLESDATMIFNSVSSGEIESFSSDSRCTLAGVESAKDSEGSRLLAEADFPSSKFLACLNLVKHLVNLNKSVIVWCVFIRSIEQIVDKLVAGGFSAKSITGATEPEERARILDEFKNGSIRVLVTNPHTLAESVSLHSVCHDAVYYEYSYNLIHLLQSKDRINRLGLPKGQYTQYYYLQTVFSLNGKPWSLDENIYNRLKEKEQTMLDAIDRGVLEAGSTDERDLELVFKGLFDN
ncbi:SNF2-related protein [Enorma massiliensis]|uniref:SNF2-related protein n=1 Tax=Enorma massiliensis TaxID=1472761 RepID=UPI003AF00F63